MRLTNPLKRFFRRKSTWEHEAVYPDRYSAGSGMEFDSSSIPELAPDTNVDETIFLENLALIDERKSLQEQTDALRNDIARLKVVLNKLSMHRENLLNEREEVVSQTRQQKEKLEKEIENLNSHIASNGTIIKQLQERCAILLKQRQDTIAKNRDELIKLEEEVQQLKEQMALRKTQLTELDPFRKLLLEKESSRETLEQRIAELSATLNTLQVTAKHTHDNVERLETKIATERNVVAQLNEEATALEQRHLALQDLQKQRALELNSVQENLMEIENLLQEKQTILHNQAAELKTIKKTITTQESERSNLENQQQQLAERLDILRIQSGEQGLDVNYSTALSSANTTELLSPLTLEANTDEFHANNTQSQSSPYRFLILGLVLVTACFVWLYYWFNQDGIKFIRPQITQTLRSTNANQPMPLTDIKIKTFQLSNELSEESKLMIDKNK